MAFKLVVLCSLLAYANAGGIVAPVAAYSPAAAVSSSYIHQSTAPVATYAHAAPVATYAHAAPVATYAHAAPVATYAHAAPIATYAQAPVAVHAPHYGATSQSVLRSLGGNQAVSHYSKAVDSAFSSVRKYDTRITNDALSYSPVAAYASPIAHATYAHAAPVVAKTIAPVATYSHAATYAAPVATYAHAAPVATYAHAAPVATYAHAAPVATYAHAAPVATYAHAAPVAAYAAGPVVAKAALSYSPAAVVSHANFHGLGAHYEW